MTKTYLNGTTRKVYQVYCSSNDRNTLYWRQGDSYVKVTDSELAEMEKEKDNHLIIFVQIITPNKIQYQTK